MALYIGCINIFMKKNMVPLQGTNFYNRMYSCRFVILFFILGLKLLWLNCLLVLCKINHMMHYLIYLITTILNFSRFW